VPPGYHVEKPRDGIAVLGGAALFGGSYGLAVLWAQLAPDSPGRDWLYVPCIGPIAAAIDPTFNHQAGHEAGLPLGVIAGGQIGGLVLIVFALVAPRAKLVADGPRRAVVPAVGPARQGTGLGLTWSF
jgi:hypothetical protein